MLACLLAYAVCGYTVQDGDSLTNLADAFGTDPDTLMMLNPDLTNIDTMYAPGSQMNVPC